MVNICYRNKGCFIRSHKHCGYNCNIKHCEAGEKCFEVIETLNFSKPGKCKKTFFTKKNIAEKFLKKYNIKEIVKINDTIYNLYRLFYESFKYIDANDLKFIEDTFLSNKAITNEVSITWIRHFLVYILPNNKNANEILNIILLFELFNSNRYNYLLQHKKFKSVFIKKYHEFIGEEIIFFSEYIRITFFKNILQLCLKNEYSIL